MLSNDSTQGPIEHEWCVNNTSVWIKDFVALQNLMDVTKINKFKTLAWNPLVTFTLCTYMLKRFMKNFNTKYLEKTWILKGCKYKANLKEYGETCYMSNIGFVSNNCKNKHLTVPSHPQPPTSQHGLFDTKGYDHDEINSIQI